MKNNKNYKGKHYIDTFSECKIENCLLSQPLFFKDRIGSKIEEVGLHTVGYAEKKFNVGFTAVWLLEESHISVHTWPEWSVVDIDLYVCNYKEDNSKKVKLIYDFIKNLFKPEKNRLIIINR